MRYNIPLTYQIRPVPSVNERSYILALWLALPLASEYTATSMPLPPSPFACEGLLPIRVRAGQRVSISLIISHIGIFPIGENGQRLDRETDGDRGF